MFDIETIELLQDLVERRITNVLMEKRAAPSRPDWARRTLREIDDELLKLYNAAKELRVAWDEFDIEQAVG